MTDYEKLFDYIGEFGTFQLWLFVSLSTIVAMGMESMQINFIAGEMEHWCDVAGVNHLPHSQQKHVAIPQDGDDEYERCHYFVHNYSSFSDEELMNWNRSVMNPAGTPQADCTGWVYDQSEYYSTFMSTVKETIDLLFISSWDGMLFCSLNSFRVMYHEGPCRT